MVNLPWRDLRFTNGIGVLKKSENPLNTMNALDDLQLHGTRKMLCWCLNVFEKIAAKHLKKLLRLHTSRRRRLRESIYHKWPQFWQSDDWYFLHDNAPAHRSQLVKDFLAKTRTNTLPHLSYSPDIALCDICQFPSTKKPLQGHRFVSSDEVKVASQEALQEVGKNGLQLRFLKLCECWQKRIVAQGDYFEGGSFELFRVRISSHCPQTFGSYYVEVLDILSMKSKGNLECIVNLKLKIFSV
ncbi:putative mariner transposase [Trichonephila clavipes]|nr:putative mariner transposase [Trichonephila clavipes]